MAMYPGSTPHLLDTKYLSGAPIAVYNRVNLHVAVSESSSLFSQFNRSGQASSHFYVRRDGSSEQYVDTALQAEADLDGNDATISIETQGGVNDADNEPWTDQQLSALAAIFKWAMDTHGIRNQMASTSQTNDSSKGLSWHRLGIDGTFPALPNPCAGRGQRGGGMKYSSSGGKLCPGCGKINQIPEIFARAGGATPTPPDPGPGPGPTPPSGGLAVDGFWGSSTTTRLQQVLGMQYVDGEVWYQYKPNAQKAFTSGWVYNWVKGTSGSPVIAEMQRRMGIAADGVWGTDSTNALQLRYYPGYAPDGFLAGPSNTVMRMQEALNNGTF
ncbi:MAG: peptidoglycan recognition family protein [Jiangellaceae bacterium]